jgi:hypothetical protein
MTQQLEIYVDRRITYDAIRWLIDRGNYQGFSRQEAIHHMDFWLDAKDLKYATLPVRFTFNEDERDLAMLFKLTWGGNDY